LDEAILIYFKSPHSYTGEDVVEIQTHGGVIVSSLILERVLRLGARVANGGEFTKRAFLNGKLDLTKAEAILAIINSKSEDSIKMLAKQLKGELKEFVERLREKLLVLLAHIEVNIDYAEEDLPKDLQLTISDSVNEVIDDIKSITRRSKQKEGLIEGFKIAIIGKPNVGKSSLLNSLLDYNRAITSPLAGTTRDTIEESIKIGTHLVKFVDTAGIRESGDEIEREGIKRSIEALRQSDIVIAMFDSSTSFDEDDKKIIDVLKSEAKQKRVFVVLNKIDLESKFDLTKLSGFDIVKTVAKQSVDELVEEIEEYLNSISQEDDIILTSKRQIVAFEDCKEALIEAKKQLESGSLEFFSYEINDAIEKISSVTKPYERGEILDKMFGEFCLGK
jgi:tRNA modification GTPase